MYNVAVTEKRYLQLYTAERQITDLFTLLTQTDDAGKTFGSVTDVVEHVRQLNLKIKELETEVDEMREEFDEYKAKATEEHDTYCARCGKTFRYNGEHEPTHCSRACELGVPEQPPQGSLLTEDQFHASLRAKTASA